jgi:hypothetical protein
MNSVYPDNDRMFWSSGQEQTATQSQAEAEHAARVSLVEWLTTDPVVVSTNLSGIYKVTHVSQLQNRDWIFAGTFDDLPNRGVRLGDIEPEPANAVTFDRGLYYSTNMIADISHNYHDMNTVSKQGPVVNLDHRLTLCCVTELCRSLAGTNSW